MSEISRVALFGKLNPVVYKTIEGATVFCKLRGNPYVELVHWLTQLLENSESDIHAIVRHYALDAAVLARDVTAALDRLPRGSTSLSDFAEHIPDAIERAWVYGSLQFGDGQVRSAYLLLGILKTPSLRNAVLAISREFAKIKLDDLAENLESIVAKSGENGLGPQDGSGLSGGQPGEVSGAMAPAAMGKQEALKKYTIDLTDKARKGEIDPISGRDEEIRQIVDILMRRRQNNPILTGEAGVGKTAVVEGFAQRLARGDVPPQLQGVSLLTLDLGLLQAGASMKGEFEQRLRQVIDEVQASPKPIILFIDEIHTLVGAGGAAGTGDAANLLKPALARGNLRTIGATTWAEYKKYIEKDPALTRRFQVVQVPEPDELKAVLMLRGVASVLEKHHRVQLLDEAIEAAVRLSHRYIPARQLPDKAVSLLDTACARVAVSQHAIPAEVEDARRRIESLEVEQGIIGREEAVGVHIGVRGSELPTLFRLSEQEDIIFSEADLPTGFHYVALGHIHRAQFLHGQTHIRYSGSIERLDLGEQHNSPGVVLFDIAATGRVGEPEVLPLPGTPVYEVTLLDPHADLERLKAAGEDVGNDLVNLHIHYTPGEHNLEEILCEAEKVYPRWYARDWVQTNTLGETLTLGEADRSKSLREIVRGYADTELQNHDEFEKQELLTLLGQIIDECEPGA